MRIRPLSILPRTTRKNSLARPEKVCTQWVGLDGIWILSQITQKLTPIGQKHSHCLANYSKSVVIGYSGRKLPWKLLTIVNNEKPLPRDPFVCSCWVPIRVIPGLEFIVNLPRNKTRFWFINHGSRLSNLSEGGLFSVRYWLGLLLNEISSYSDQEKLKFTENVWKRLTRWAIWLPSVSGILSVILCGAGWKYFPS